MGNSRLKRCTYAMIALLSLASLLLSGCAASESNDELDVLVSIYPQKEMVKAIGGDEVSVTVMVPPGASPATYDPTSSKLTAVSRADVYFMEGALPFENAYRSRMEELNPSMRIVDISREIDYILSESEKKDPHVWLSPTNVKKQAKVVAETLSQVDEQNSRTYREGLERYREKLDSLHANMSARFSSLNTTTFIVYHPAWSYLAEDYGLEQIPIQRHGSDPTARYLREVIDRGRDRSVKVVLVQEQFSTKQAKQVAKQVNATVLQLDPLAEDYVSNMDSMSRRLTNALGE